MGLIFLIPGLLDQAFIANLYHSLGENAARFCSARRAEGRSVCLCKALLALFWRACSGWF